MMTSLGEVQRIIGLSLSKIQMGRNQRGGLPLHKNLLVATVLNKARDVYMQETMYMNYRLMACGQFDQEEHEDIEDDDTPDTEDYEEDSESDVEDDSDSSASKDYAKEFVGPSSSVPASTSSKIVDSVSPSGVNSSCCVTSDLSSAELFNNNVDQTDSADTGDAGDNTCAATITQDEGFIDESDCDCDTRNFSESESRVPFQYCFSCAPFHPSNGRGPTLVGPQSQVTHPCPPAQTHVEQEEKVIYDMDLKSTQNQTSSVKRKRTVTSEETEDAVNSIVPKRRRDSSEEENLDDSGFQEEEKVRLRLFIIKDVVYNCFIFRCFTPHSGIITRLGATEPWRWIRSPASSRYSPSVNKPSLQPTRVEWNKPVPSRRHLPKMMTTPTVTVTRAVTVVTPVMTTRRTMMTKPRRLRA